MRSAGGESDRSDCNATTWKTQSAINADAMLCNASEASSKKSRNQEIKKSRNQEIKKVTKYDIRR